MAEHPEQKTLCVYLDALEAAGFLPTSVNNGGEETELTPNREAVLSEATTTDEACINFGATRWLYVVYGNQPHELVNDYSCKEGDEFGKVIDRVSDELDQKEAALTPTFVDEPLTLVSAPFVCHACAERVQDWVGSAPKCAFPNGLPFQSENWNCATLEKFRELTEDRQVWREDSWYVVVPMPLGSSNLALYASGYKRRGRVDVLAFPTRRAEGPSEAVMERDVLAAIQELERSGAALPRKV